MVSLLVAALLLVVAIVIVNVIQSVTTARAGVAEEEQTKVTSSVQA